MADKDCLLCNLKHETCWYAETEKLIICKCKTCGVPMYVWKEHTFPNQTEISLMIADAGVRFPGRLLDLTRRSIQDHWHMHVR